jgi:hypothetical protein
MVARIESWREDHVSTGWLFAAVLAQIRGQHPEARQHDLEATHRQLMQCFSSTSRKRKLMSDGSTQRVTGHRCIPNARAEGTILGETLVARRFPHLRGYGPRAAELQ